MRKVNIIKESVNNVIIMSATNDTSLSIALTADNCPQGEGLTMHRVMDILIASFQGNLVIKGQESFISLFVVMIWFGIRGVSKAKLLMLSSSQPVTPHPINPLLSVEKLSYGLIQWDLQVSNG